MGARLSCLLHEAWERQKALNEPKVFVAPTTGRPIDLSRISVVSRTAMIRGGLENFSLRALCTWAAAQKTGELLTAQAERQGSLVREDVMRLLNVSANTAWSCLNRLAESGQLEKVGVRYYPKGPRRPAGGAAGGSPGLSGGAFHRQPAGLCKAPARYTPSGHQHPETHGGAGGADPGGEALSAAAGDAACRKIKLRLMIVLLWPIFIKMRFSCTSVTVGPNPFTMGKCPAKVCLAKQISPFSFPV